jgi:hypothetical protein
MRKSYLSIFSLLFSYFAFCQGSQLQFRADKNMSLVLPSSPEKFTKDGVKAYVSKTENLVYFIAIQDSVKLKINSTEEFEKSLTLVSDGYLSGYKNYKIKIIDTAISNTKGKLIHLYESHPLMVYEEIYAFLTFQDKYPYFIQIMTKNSQRDFYTNAINFFKTVKLSGLPF